MRNNGLDEMQLQRKNKIGNQSFLLLLFLLLLDAGLYGFGFRWLSYPANIMLILSFCSAIYVVRLIKANAYVGPSNDSEKPVLLVILNVVVAVSVAMVIVVLLRNSSFVNSGQINEMAAPVLFITSGVAVIISVAIVIIKKIQNQDDLD